MTSPSSGPRGAARLLRHLPAAVGSALLVTFLAAALIGPAAAPGDPYAMSIEHRLEAPSRTSLLGTDEFGRDILTRLFAGARISLAIATCGVLISAAVGIPLGTWAGYAGRTVDRLVMGLVDLMLAFPGLLLAVVIITILGFGITNVILAIGIFSIPTYARLARSVVLSVKEREFVEAARAAGLGGFGIVARHILPNSVAPLIVHTSLRMGTALLTASGLSFLGLGAQPPSPEWGAMLATGREYMRVAPHLVLFPGLAIVWVVLGFNLLGDGLRDLLDPRTRTRARSGTEA